MAYIGRDINYGNAVTQQITGNNGAGYAAGANITAQGGFF